MFENTDVKYCPILSYEIVDEDENEIVTPAPKEGEEVVKEKLIIIEEGKKVVINQKAFTEPITLQIKVITDIGEPVFKKIVMKEKTPC